MAENILNLSNGSGSKLLNLTTPSPYGDLTNNIGVGYSLPFNYLDGFVDFNWSNDLENDYQLGYSQTSNTSSDGPLTHFNGIDSCNIGFFALSQYPYANDNSYPLIRRFCHLKNKYISISGTSINIGTIIAGGHMTNDLLGDNLPFYVTTPLASTSYKLMVEGYIPNVKYFLTESKTWSQGLQSQANDVSFFGDQVISGTIFPLYFPKRDTLMFTNNKLDQV